ncbi:YbhB/YbcL family Raf kinase inhibitor-like protein [candidate division Kazan bacterium]|uniref:YbhB/YbcL family Raf kinase inhibitor-like protein n=1 Tax=candidate division Kazan bacterium TaxID=2202143 RepID=A0A420ZDX1_UNCK3|nr:MAG: YbhB/YbcL family Raf kinase inhibitor-like protein [candidate division Kazan bacterium]
MDNLVLASPAFTEGGSIPAKYTGEGENINPPLKISGVPENARSLVLIMDDPDAPMGVWDHWIVWNIPPQTAEIKEGELPAGAVVGTNSFGNQNYGGPYPPPGPAHRYVFKLYALNQGLDLSAGAKKSEVEKAMEGKILAQTTLTGKYNR